MNRRERIVRTGLLVLCIAASFGLSACSSNNGSENAADASATTGDAPSNTDGDVEVAGTWLDNFGTTTTITNESWGDTALTNFDNQANMAITQNPADAEFGPSEFNKLVWTEPADDGSWYLCIIDYGKMTADEALNSTNVADDTDPANGGCGTFEWTHMMPAEEG